MEFINDTGKKVVARIKKGNFYDWVTIKEGDKIDLPKSYGINLGLTVFGEPREKEEEEDSKDVKEIFEQKEEPAETEPAFEEGYEEELKEIKGVGDKIASDIIRVFPTKEKLVEAVRSGLRIPVRDDIEDKIKEKYR